MAATNIRGTQVVDGSIQRPDLDITTVGKAVVAKLVQGTGIALSSTGADAGTGDVTISTSGDMSWKGAWNSGTAYRVGDVVSRQNTSYVAVTANTNQDPLIPSGSASNIGNTTQGGSTGTFQGISAVKITLGASSGSLQSLSVFWSAGGSAFNIGLYSDSGGTPAGLLATCNPASSAVGVNTLSTTTNPTLSANTSYWVAALTGSPGIGGYYNSGGAAAWNNATAYGSGVMPSTFPYSAGSTGAFNYSLYATISTTAGINSNWNLLPAGVSNDAGNIATIGSDSMILVPASSIWSVRLRSFNAIGNPNFEVDQRNVGSTLINAANNTFAQDRWKLLKNGTMQVSIGQQPAATGNVLLPGTNFKISSYYSEVQLNTQEASLAAGDYLVFSQALETVQMRELFSDVHSFSLLVRSSVAGLKFGLTIQDSNQTHTLTKLCTIPSSNVWTLITLPNLPALVSTGNWGGAAPGALGANLMITLASGVNFVTSANDTWQAVGNVFAAIGQSNFAGSAVNSTFDIAFAQWEPGAVCTTLMDKPFTGANGNYEECLRYFCKSWPYGTAVGTASIDGFETFIVPLGTASTLFRGATKFPKPMAKAPTIATWGYAGGAGGVSTISTGQAVTGWAVNATSGTEKGFTAISTGTATGTTIYAVVFHYTADTGW